MILYPAIDLKDGVCVRLRHGKMASATVYNRDPADQARLFRALGFRWLHVVDLDGAFAGEPVNAAAVRSILAATDVPVQIGGGIRDIATIEAWLEAGIRRVILGTAALKNPDLVRRAAAKHPGRVCVGIDAKDGRVAVEGWAETSTVTARALAEGLKGAGVAAIVHTDIGRDGDLKGVNVEAAAELARGLGIPVIASGGVGGLDDIRRLIGARPAGIAGAIVGRALYDGRLDARAALALAEAA
jgi:phosphoribosylformimino-5-aminoimidazole carboxamide ribotide isomerase